MIVESALHGHSTIDCLGQTDGRMQSLTGEIVEGYFTQLQRAKQTSTKPAGTDKTLATNERPPALRVYDARLTS